MKEQLAAQLRQWLLEGKEKAFIPFRPLDLALPELPVDLPDLDEVLFALENAGIEIRAYANRDHHSKRLVKQSGRKPVNGQQASNLFDFVSDDDPLEVYKREVSRVPRLTPTRENLLTTMIVTGGTEAARARKELMEAHLWLVLDLVTEYAEVGKHMLDLVQEGNNGLMKACDRLAPHRRARLATHAAFWIHRALDRFTASGP